MNQAIASSFVFAFLLTFLATNAYAGSDESTNKIRKHPVEMYLTGSEKLGDLLKKVISLDVGIEEKRESPDASRPTCTLQEPQKFIKPGVPSRTATRKAAPYDFYASRLPGEKIKADEVGEPDIFWPGDDGNRNRDQKDPHTLTMAPHAAFSECLGFFGLVWSQARDSFSQVVSFIRGTRDDRGQLAFRALLTARAFVDESGPQPVCDAFTEMCLDLEQKGESIVCKADAKKYSLHKIVAAHNYDIAWGEYFTIRRVPETEKHDIDRLTAVVSDLDPETGLPLKGEYNKIVAEKIRY